MSDDDLEQLIETLNADNAAVGKAPFEYKSIPQGAATSVWAAVIAPVETIGGLYCEDCHVAELSDEPGLRGGVQPYALNADRARALWAKSEQLVGETF